MINKIRTNIKFSFIGCGLIGNKRANFLDVNSIIGCYDSDKSKAKIFSKKYSCIFYKYFKNMIRDSDAIIISTPHRYLAKFAIQSKLSSLSHPNETEERYKRKRGLARDRRLGCQAQILDDLVIDVPKESQLHKQVVRKSADLRKIKMSPATQLFYVEVAKPNLKIPSGDCERLEEALKIQWGIKNLSISLSVNSLSAC